MILTKERLIGDNRMSQQEKIEMFESLLMSTNRPGIEKVIEYVRGTDFYTAPASSKYHSNYDGGLLDHCLCVYACAEDMREQMIKYDPVLAENIPVDSLIICTLLHDICKTSFYRKTIKYRKNEHNDWESYYGYEIEDTFPIGHGEKSVIMLQKIGIELTLCEMLAIRYHMGFWGEQNTEFKMAQKNAINMCPLVVVLQVSDFMANSVLEEEID